MTHICPLCGYDTQVETGIASGRVEYDPLLGVTIDGKRLKVRRRCHEIIGALMRAGGRPLSALVLAERMGIAEERTWENNISVLMTMTRRALEQEDIAGAIETIRGYGYRWAMPLCYPDIQDRNGAHDGRYKGAGGR
jgi:DNA-binding response OmpR family regulator